ncbi:hypothetical protein AVEN_117716-1 [Araneus ventricosus]|uniref:MATH domain-containing protein n=1 Tax=Araneus ventricosus TaxID=182803 RepID=A0A4Y2PXJ5_ARAVE|nr:hypothetical protein AVEN_117716-1 [Araneus ventricosus]
MATADTPARAHFTYIWTIENVSKLTQIRFKSPSFVAHSVSKSKWYLEIEEILDICCCLRSEDARKELPSAIDAEFSFLAADGSPLISKRNDKHSFFIFLLIKDVSMERWADFISNNTLTVRFRMWRKGCIIKTTDFCYARTKLKTYTRSFLWPIEEFSALNSSTAEDFSKLATDERKIYPLKNFTQNSHFMALILYLKRNSETEDVCVDFLVEKGTDYGYKCEITVVDVNGEIIASKLEGVRTHFRSKILNFWNLISKSKLISNKNLFLPNNTLLLRCSLEVCTGVISSEIENCTPNVSSVVKEDEVLEVNVAAMDDEDFHCNLRNTSLKI